MYTLLSNKIHNFLNIIFPNYCIICHIPLKDKTPLCNNCWKTRILNKPPFCSLCGISLIGQASYKRKCAHCLLFSTTTYYDYIFFCFHYQGVIKKSIEHFKYRFKLNLLHLLGKEMTIFYHKYILSEIKPDMITEVPLHKRKYREREFNQAKLLAKFLAKETALPYFPLLKKTYYHRPQVGLTAWERKRNVKDSFAINKELNFSLKDKIVLLIDDVISTGATVNECARVLKEQRKVKTVVVFSLARGKISC